MSIIDKQGRRKNTPESRRKELFEHYLSRTDRINNWDLVDLGAPYVLGRYLFDKPRNVLHELARSAGKKDRQRLMGSLDECAATMPRTMPRYAMEHLDKERRAHYVSMKKASEAGQAQKGDRS